MDFETLLSSSNLSTKDSAEDIGKSIVERGTINGKGKSGRLHQPIFTKNGPLAQTFEEYSGDLTILHSPKYEDFKKFYPNF